jgi:CheY-like chemotaxis protein
LAHAEEERAAAERAEAERLQQQARAAAERAAAERAEAERAEAERAEAERAEAERAEAERMAAKRMAAERMAAERMAAEREAAERAESERAEAERAQAERRLAQRLEAERETAARAERERVAAEQAEAQAQADAAAAQVAQQLFVAKTPAQTTVLVVDDSKVVRIKTGRLLAQHQYQVSYAGDGLDAAHQLQQSLPDLVITDVEMPGMDGFELTRHIRAEARTAHLPVIMITAADDRHREQAEAAGVSVLLGKPYPEDELIAHIRRALGQEAAAGLVELDAQAEPA